jgi:hypothetical protein
MTNAARLRTSFLALIAGLFCCFAAQAQKGMNTVIISTDGGMSVAANTDLSASPAMSSSILKMNLPPAPETNASFYDDSRKDLHQSLDWMLETNAVAPTYWNLYTEARIRLKLKDYAGARSTAEKAYGLSLKSMPASQEYVMLCAAVVAKAHELAKQ